MIIDENVILILQLHMFAIVPDAEVMDDIIFTLPGIKELGDQVESSAKSVRCLP